MLSKKIDFAIIIGVKNANPNGDPLNGNRPRVNYDGLGEISDVCLKRKIRNRLLDDGANILVQSDDYRNDKYRSIKDRYDSNENITALGKKASSDDVAEAACKEWFDVRAFGQVLAFKGKNDKEAGVSIAIRGPVSIQSAFSLDTVDVESLQITKSVNLETMKNPSKRWVIQSGKSTESAKVFMLLMEALTGSLLKRQVFLTKMLSCLNRQS